MGDFSDNQDNDNMSLDADTIAELFRFEPSAADQMVETFWQEEAVLVKPVPTVFISNHARYRRILKRRETRAFLSKHYAAARRKKHASRQAHAGTRQRYKGRFATKEEMTAAKTLQEQWRRGVASRPNTTNAKAPHKLASSASLVSATEFSSSSDSSATPLPIA